MIQTPSHMYTVTKEIHFCYGHRLLNHSGKCRFLHGHNANAVIRLESTTLNTLGMVCDFSDIGDYVKTWINKELDHNMLMHKEDPLLPALQQAGERVYVMQHNPTAENIAKLIFDYVAAGGFPVVEVTIYETASALASYRRD
ncbi:MAG: 6-carboxytetrahydropterin synthase [Chromatiales bacterium]